MRLNDVGNIKGSNILFLQGPMGDFFSKLEVDFESKGAKVFRIGFNGGDRLFSRSETFTPYRGKREDWPLFIKRFLVENKINKIFLFGDCRYYQSIAIQAAKSLSVCSFVFEEGYVRPHYITLERGGVNNHSMIPRDRAFYDALDLKSVPFTFPVETNFNPRRKVLSAMMYYAAGNITTFLYPYYKHHRDFSGLKEMFFGLRSAFRLYKYRFKEEGVLGSFILPNSNNYFLVPLQTFNDFQLRTHSRFESIEHFIGEVISSYAENGPSEFLCFKHHPMDRGRKNYSSFIYKVARSLGVEDKVKVLYDVHLPTTLKNAKGVVTINSTVGLSALYHGVPTKPLGEAVYDIDGITNMDASLDEFWRNPVPPSPELFKKFYRYLIFTTQLNASFFGGFPELGSTGGGESELSLPCDLEQEVKEA